MGRMFLLSCPRLFLVVGDMNPCFDFIINIIAIALASFSAMSIAHLMFRITFSLIYNRIYICTGSILVADCTYRDADMRP
jgi:hypothetical protein